MNNQINATPSFQGNFVVKSAVKIKDSKRLANIQQLFSKKTSEYPKDSLVLGMVKDDGIEAFHNKDAKDLIFPYSEGFNHLLDSFSDNEVAKKLVKVFKSLKTEKAYNDKNEILMSDVDDLTAKVETLSGKAKLLREDGYAVMADRYDTLAGFSQRKLDAVSAELQKQQKAFADKIDRIAENDPMIEVFAACVR